jgi:hypothetical protein
MYKVRLTPLPILPTGAGEVFRHSTYILLTSNLKITSCNPQLRTSPLNPRIASGVQRTLRDLFHLKRPVLKMFRFCPQVGDAGRVRAPVAGFGTKVAGFESARAGPGRGLAPKNANLSFDINQLWRPSLESNQG